jgi:hypothetical protein
MTVLALQLVPKIVPKTQHSDKPVVAFRPDYITATGDIVAGYVLSQLVYLYQRATNGKPKHHLVDCKDGHWVVRSYAQWAEELHLTYAQIRRAVARLASLGIVQTAIRLAGRDAVTHLRLTCADGSAVIDGYPEFGLGHEQMPSETDPPVMSSSTPCAVAHTPLCCMTDPPVLKDIPLKALDVKEMLYMKEAGQLPPALAVPKTPTGEPLMKAEDVVASVKAKKASSLPPKNVGPLYLYGVWEECLKEIGVQWVGPAKSRELGDLKNFLRQVGPVVAEQSLRWAVFNWHSYVSQVRIDKGDDGLPQSPVTWLLAKYPDTIMQSIAQQQKEAQGWSKPLQHVKPSSEVVETSTLPKKKNKFAQQVADDINAKKV